VVVVPIEVWIPACDTFGRWTIIVPLTVGPALRHGGQISSMTAILGISAFYHDSAAALLVDGEIVAAAQEERFTRKKHDADFPSHAIAYCLSAAGIGPEHLDYVGFYEKPLSKFERLLESYLAYAPRGFNSFRQALPVWVRKKLQLRREIHRGLSGRYKGPLVLTDHHEAHAASAFFPSPFSEAAILTVDGVGEWSTACYGHGRGSRLELTHELRFPHSLGLLYAAFTYYTGFRVNSGEYKVMGLAPYGQPVYKELILRHLIDLKDDGSFRMDMRYFNYCQGLTMTSAKFHRLFGGPPRKPEAKLTQRDMDLAASIQSVTEEIMLRMVRHVHRQTRAQNLVMAGGVALNCVANGRILREGPFEQIWIQPAAGDAGGALGVALFTWFQLLGQPRKPSPSDSQRGSLLGPAFDDESITSFLDRIGAIYHGYHDENEMLDRVVQLLADDKVVGWFQGHMEFGPRALGARSILGDARSPSMQSRMNRKIKFRESFRPFAPCVLRENVDEYFQVPPGQDSPYMLLVASVQPDKRKPRCAPALPDVDRNSLDKLKESRSVVPAITHIDCSARVQTVDPERHGRFYRLLKRFYQKTDCPVLINTSFNVRGEPIVCTPEDAYRCFMGTHMDALVLEKELLLKEEQPMRRVSDRGRYVAQFILD
jgi:carbamoyltransferase